MTTKNTDGRQHEHTSIFTVGTQWYKNLDSVFLFQFTPDMSSVNHVRHNTEGIHARADLLHEQISIPAVEHMTSVWTGRNFRQSGERLKEKNRVGVTTPEIERGNLARSASLLPSPWNQRKNPVFHLRGADLSRPLLVL